MLDDVLQYIAPHHCFGCGKTGNILCSDCKYDIVDEVFSGCIVCAKPSVNGICGACKSTYEAAWCVGGRDGCLEQIINSYKFERLKAAGSLLASLLDETLPVLPPNTRVVPVPTVRSHIRIRGYDHAQILAREFAKRRKLKVTSSVSRTNTVAQRELNRKDRFLQASSAFMCDKKLADVPYLLIDDIVTTNATIRYAANALKNAGAKTVWVAVVARQPIKRKSPHR